MDIQVGDGGCALGMAPLAESIHQGMCYAHNYQHRGKHGYGSETSRRTKRELRELGVEWLSLTPFGFMRSLGQASVHHVGEMPGGETDARMRAEIESAQHMGFRVMLKPHIWIRGGEWRGKIDPGSRDAWRRWHESYRRWLLRYARMAERHDVAVLVIGTELKSSALQFPERWRELTRAVRAVYDGEVVYAANWDAVPEITWWDAVDAIGVQFYAPLADHSGATTDEMRQKMETYTDVLAELVARWQRPVIFTEVGYKSAEGTAADPYTWPQHLGENKQGDERAQARATRVFLEGIRGHDWVLGVYWWKWFTDPSSEEGGRIGFSPRDKLAESVLRAAYGAHCAGGR